MISPGHATEYDAVNQLCAASGQLMVRDTFVAGSMQHFSMRSGKISATALKIKLFGILCLRATWWSIVYRQMPLYIGP